MKAIFNAEVLNGYIFKILLQTLMLLSRYFDHIQVNECCCILDVMGYLEDR